MNKSDNWISKKRVLLTGVSGQLGHQLHFDLRNCVELIAPVRRDFDLSRPNQLRQKIRDWSPDLIINAAAFTNVEEAEDNREQVWKVNAEAPVVIAEEAKKAGSILFQFSTDYVFDGKKDGFYVEEDLSNPINFYGKSKLAAEFGTLQVSEKTFVFRTSWVYSKNFGNNFYRKMVDLFCQKKSVSIVTDQFGCPTPTERLSSAIKPLIMSESLYSNHFDKWGLYHLAGDTGMSWFDFAQSIFEAEKNKNSFIVEKLVKISSNDFPTKAVRPKNSQLSSRKFFTAFEDFN